MLKRKLQERIAAIDAEDVAGKQQRILNIEEQLIQDDVSLANPSEDVTPLWKQFYEIECELNKKLKDLDKPLDIIVMYNPIEYAAEIHCAYLQKFLTGKKRLMFVGMNPGPNGMGQTGIPFGNISTVRDLMKITGEVSPPTYEISVRPITGMMTKTEEPSGKRLWNLFYNIARSMDTFSQQCFVHNFCPLIFYGSNGKNVTPGELKADHKAKVRDWCLQALEKQLLLVQPEIVVAVGEYVATALKKSKYCNTIKTMRLAHPSPRSVNNQDWPEKAKNFIMDNDLLKYLQNSQPLDG